MGRGFQPDGEMPEDKTISGRDDAIGTFFPETGAEKHAPRTALPDLMPTVVDEVRTETYRQLFPPEELISEKENADTDVAKRRDAIEQEAVDLSLNRGRQLTDTGAGLQGFPICNAMGGDAGSGLEGLMLERLSADYEKKPKFSFTEWSRAQESTAVVKPYNAVLRIHSLLERRAVTNRLGLRNSLQGTPILMSVGYSAWSWGKMGITVSEVQKEKTGVFR